MIVINTLFPLLALMVLGYFLKQRHITSTEFLKTLDKLVYYIFFPAMLFWKTAGATKLPSSSTGLVLSGMIAMTIVSVAGLLYIKKSEVTAYGAGSFYQACCRFNTYIGMAVVLAVLKEEGVRLFSILIGFVIPFANVLSVSVLIWNSGQSMSVARRTGYLFRALISNPLILGCAGGMLLSRIGVALPVFISNTFALISSMTLPLALISMGGILNFSGISRHRRAAFAAAGIKLIMLPVTGFILLKLFGVSDTAFKTGMIFFCLPASTAIHVLSGQLNSDVELGSTAVMVSTLLSFISLSAALMLV